MLKTSSIKLAKPRKGGDGVDGDNKAGCGGSKINESGMNNIEIDSGEVDVDEIEKKVQKLSKNLFKSKKMIRSSDFLTFGAKLVFIKLRQAFLKAPILHQIDPERHIRIETMYQAMLLVESSVSSP